MISFQKHAYRALFIVVLGLGLFGCGGSSTISNGANLANLSGAANSHKDYSIKLPDRTISLMVEAAGSTNITLDLLDASRNSLGACFEALRCVLNTPAAGTYTLRLSASTAYSGVNLSASWGGPDVSVLQNDVPITGLKGAASTVLLKSLYLDADQVALALETTEAPGTFVELLDHAGNPVWPCGFSSCLARSVRAGLYFARLQLSESFSSASLTARWGGSLFTTLENGVTKPGLSGTAGSQFIESFFLPTGVNAAALTTNQPGIYLEVVSTDAQPVSPNCIPALNGTCIIQDLPSGLYYVVGSLSKDIPDFSLTLRFGGDKFSSLTSGQPTEPQPSRMGDVYLESFYVSEGTSSAAIVSPPNSIPRIYDSAGNLLCEYAPCSLSNLAPGPYFATITVEGDWIPFVNTSLALGGPAQATLTNGQTKRGTIHFPEQSSVESFYIDSDEASFAVAGSSNGEFYTHIFGPHGEFITQCDQTKPCISNTQTRGTYFVHTDFGAGDAYSIALAIGTPNNSTLTSGQPTEPQPSRMGDVYLESFYVSEGTSSAAIVSPPNSIPRIYDSAGSLLCEYTPCFLSNLTPGAYFVATTVEGDWIPFVNTSLALGGPAQATLTNGQTKRGAIHFPEQSSVESFYIDSDEASFAVAGSSNGEFYTHIFGPHGEFITQCDQTKPCIANTQTKGTYFVHTDFGAGDAYSIALAIGGPENSTLKIDENTPGTPAMTGDVFAQSFFYTPDNGIIGFAGSSATHSKIYDSNGNPLCEGRLCVLANLEMGSYFAVSTASGYTDNYTVNFSLAAASPTHSSIGNGETLFDLKMNIDSSTLKSIYIPENADYANRFDTLMIGTAFNYAWAEVFDGEGRLINTCDISLHCELQNITGAVFFILMDAYGNTTENPVSLSAAWAGENLGSIENGISKTLESKTTPINSIQSFYLGAASDVSLIFSDTPTYTLFTNATGQVLMECVGNCTLQGLAPGKYFITFYAEANIGALNYTVSW